MGTRLAQSIAMGLLCFAGCSRPAVPSAVPSKEESPAAVPAKEEAPLSTSTAGEPPSAAPFQIKSKAEISVGADQTMQFVITAGPGFKWNQAYPSHSASLPNGLHVDFAKPTFSKIDGDVTEDDHAGTITLKGTGKSAGTETIEAQLRFGICTVPMGSCSTITQTVPLQVVVR